MEYLQYLLLLQVFISSWVRGYIIIGHKGKKSVVSDMAYDVVYVPKSSPLPTVFLEKLHSWEEADDGVI